MNGDIVILTGALDALQKQETEEKEERSLEHQHLDLQYICDDQDAEIKRIRSLIPFQPGDADKLYKLSEAIDFLIPSGEILEPGDEGYEDQEYNELREGLEVIRRFEAAAKKLEGGEE